ncbi:MAG: 4-(cytidine 5'-diphospho)-2-C-methyl-D-erythritol kinase [Phycisphaerae bacterium]|nr:4-(cytidine 5'-diphospho)-2-C-methyl-D-erythritol kinase [Phycisphaerae bacterium]
MINDKAETEKEPYSDKENGQDDGNVITMPAYAKVNVSLVVFGKRADGFHELHTIMAPIGLCDQLTVRKNNGKGIFLRCFGGDAPDGPENLVFRAVELLANYVGKELAVDIELEKRIPSGAGLGGASSDAAICLLAVNRLMNLGLTLIDLAELAGELGSDVPFFLNNSVALCKGRGEIVESLPLKMSRHIMLVLSGLHVATPLIYKNYQYDEEKTTKQMESVDICLGQGDLDKLISLGINSLTEVTMSLFAPLRNLRDKLEQLGIGPVFMSGSGSTLFVTSEDIDQLKRWSKLIVEKKLAETCITEIASQR